MKKNTGKLMLMLMAVTAFLCVFVLQASAETYSGTCGNSANWSLDTETGVLNITGTGAMNDYDSFPDSSKSPWSAYADEIESVQIQSGVTSIGAYAFSGYAGLTEVSIPDSVTSIGNCAFFDSSGLTTVTIPNGVRTIGEGAFGYCVSLTSVTIPSGVETIGAEAFSGCDSLTAITIPSSVTSIGDRAFEYCGSLANINVNEENADAGNSVYDDVDGVLFNKDKTELITYPLGKTASSYVIPSSVTSIASNAFSGCKALTDVTIPSSVTSIGNFAFAYCEGLTDVTISSGVKSIGRLAFGYCANLTAINVDRSNPNYVSVDGVLYNKDKTELVICPVGKAGALVIPEGVKAISDGALYGCSKLVSISLPSGVTHIDEGQFYGCAELKDITIPTTVQEIGNEAFSDCYKIENVLYAGTEAQWNKVVIGAGNETMAYATVYFDFTGHLWYGGKVTKEATCTANGTKTYRCILFGCSETKTEVITKLGHSFTKKSTAKTYLKSAADCKNANVYYYSCTRCGEKGTKTFTSGTALGHSYKTTTTKATTSKDGSTVKKCTVCGTQASKTVIYKVTSFKLSTTSYTYNGSAKTPSVTVKDSKGKALKKDTDYTVKYASGRKNVGKYTVTVTLKGNYSGTKSLSFTINPKATSKITVTQTTTSIKATWSKVSGATGYKVYIYKGSKLVSSKTVSSKTTSYSFTKLTAGTNYTVKVKAYQTVSKVNYWSSTKSLATATKTKTPSITSVKAGSKSATVKWSNVSGENGYQVYYATSKNGTYKKGATTKANDIDATIKSLTKGKTYYFKVRAYKTADSGTVYSAWSAVKSVKVK